MSKKRVWSIIGLLVLMYCSASGNYINSGNDYFYDNCMWLGFIDLLICSGIMMIVPFIWRLANKEKFEYNKGKKICLWNSIILFLLSIVFMVIKNISFIGGIGAIIYYFINKWLFVYDSEKNSIKPKKKKIENNDVEIEESRHEYKNKFCKKCGCKLTIDNKCKKCGKQYLNFKKVFPYIVLAIMIIIIVILVVKNINYKKEIDHLLNQNWVVENDNEEYLEYWQNNHNKVDFMDENIVFVIEGYGDYYYSYDCMMNKVGTEEYSYWAYNKEQAISRGYSAGRCN